MENINTNTKFQDPDQKDHHLNLSVDDSHDNEPEKKSKESHLVVMTDVRQEKENCAAATGELVGDDGNILKKTKDDQDVTVIDSQDDHVKSIEKKGKKKRQRWKKKRVDTSREAPPAEKEERQEEKEGKEKEKEKVHSGPDPIVNTDDNYSMTAAVEYQMDETNCEAHEIPSVFAAALNIDDDDEDEKEEEKDGHDSHHDKEMAPDPAATTTLMDANSADILNSSKKKKKHKKKSTPSTTLSMDSPIHLKAVIPSNKPRTFEEELEYLEKLSHTKYRVKIGFVPNMIIPADVIVNQTLEDILLEELEETCCSCSISGHGTTTQSKSKRSGGFIPALKQMANVAALPGIVKCLAMPDVHSGYGFCIGNVAAFDMDKEESVISPGGVGFDINCGVRLLRTNLMEDDVKGEVREKIAQVMFDHIPVGVGTSGVIPVKQRDIDDILEKGIDWAIENGYAWDEDKEHCEESGRMMTANKNCVSSKAKKRGLHQIGTLGGGNHYAEVQVVDEIYNHEAAKSMGIKSVGQVCVMIHTGSRGLGHQVATDALQKMDKAMHRDGIKLNDRQLSCARINSKEGQDYLAAMSAAANYAWVNRSCITYLTRRAFQKVFDKTPEELDMHLVYDVCHNVAKIEKHVMDGKEMTLLVHRKGSTRAFPPNHPMIPEAYREIGQPALIGGTMGTCSYILVGTEKGMSETCGSTCHGAGRALSRNASRKRLDHKQVLGYLKDHNISIRVASPKLVTEEAPESYKDVSEVVDTCHDAGISCKAVKLRPIAVIKG